MRTTKTKHQLRLRRKRRVRRKVRGTTEQPRLNVYRSLQHIYVQVIDDTNGITLAATSTLDPVVKAQLGEDLDKKGEAKVVGTRLAAICKEKDITKVVFDRNGFRYHGRVSSLAQAAREGGLEF